MLIISIVFALCLGTTFADVTQLVYQPIEDAVIQPAVVATCQVLDRSGLTCRDCSTLSRCVLMIDQWQTYDVDFCDTTAGIFCNSIEERCSNSTGPCNQATFTCNEEGYFPSPFTCQEYFYCLNNGDGTLTPLRRYCNAGYAYSVATTQCTLPIRDGVCSSLQWSCSYPGQISGWAGTDDLFYICYRNVDRDELLPDIHKCLNYQIFDGQNCVNRP